MSFITWRWLGCGGRERVSRVGGGDLGGRADNDQEDGEKHQAVKQAQHQQRHQNQEEIPAIRERYICLLE